MREEHSIWKQIAQLRVGPALHDGSGHPMQIGAGIHVVRNATGDDGEDRPCWLLSPSATTALRRPPVVVMQPVEDWERDDPTRCLGRSRHGLFLPQALVWS